MKGRELTSLVRNLLHLGITVCLAVCSPPSAVAAAEPSPAAVVQDFFNFLLKHQTDIAADMSAQKRWLTPELERLFNDSTHAVTTARRLPEVDGPDPAVPDNHLFLDSWDPPSTCRASQAAVPSGPQTTVRVVCRWGAGTNYPGATRNLTVSIKRETENWRIDDIQFHKSKYAEELGLVRALKSLKVDAQALIGQSGRPAPKVAPSGGVKR